MGSFAFLRQLLRPQLCDPDPTLDRLRAMDWTDFQLLVAEGFRRLGYVVEEGKMRSPDGYIDLILRKSGHQTIVRSKHWRAKQIAVPPVRVLYELAISEGVDGALLVSSGTFTSEAHAFASDKPIGFINGEALLELISLVEGAPRPAIESGAPSCPVCQRSMVKKKGRKGGTIGSLF